MRAPDALNELGAADLRIDAVGAPFDTLASSSATTRRQRRLMGKKFNVELGDALREVGILDQRQAPDERRGSNFPATGPADLCSEELSAEKVRSAPSSCLA